MPGRTRTANPANAHGTFAAVCAIFDQVQNTSANHQKNIVALHKIFVELAQLRGRTKDGDTILIGERRFEQAIYLILLRLLDSKKGAPGDRVVKFVGGFVKYLNEKAGQYPIDEDDIDEYNVAYTPAARFTERLLDKLLFKGLGAKEKLVRYRIVHICSELVFNLGEVESRIYYELRGGLLTRINDKEHSIRSQAAIALCKFYEIDDPAELKEIKLGPLSEVLFESLAYDPQAEVRRAILLNLPVNKITIPSILERTRDVDITTRKLVYVVLERNVTIGDEEELSIGFAHPRALSIEQRESIVRNGLGDRNENVRIAAAKLIEKWVETADMTAHPQDDPNAVEDEMGLVGLLKMFDLRADKIVADAIIRIFELNPHIMDDITFNDTYWSSLTPERAFLARTCVETCENRKDDAKLEAILPVVTSFAFRLQEHFNILVDDIRSHEQIACDLDDEAQVLQQDELESKEFVVIEMLKIAISLDYGDEIGRRKMNSLIRDMLIHDFLPEVLVAPCMEVLSRLADSERDLIRVVAIEIVQALRDPGDDEDEDADQQDIDPDASFDSLDPTSPPARQKNTAPKNRKDMTEMERKRADKIDQRCLCICESMLERVNGTLENNSSLDGIVKELIYPAVQRKDCGSRERSFRCLGLISLISKNIANMALAFFIKQMKNNQNGEELRVTIMQAVFDTLMKYDQEVMVAPHSPAAWVDHFTELLEHDESSEDFRAVLCTGLAKLALPGVLADEKIMKLLLIDYFSPKNVTNQKLKQCLSFFFQAYCASSIHNQEMISSLFVPVFCELCVTSSNMADDEEMASMAQVAGMFLDWTHPNTLYVDQDKSGDEPSCLHFTIARDIVKELLNRDSKLFKDQKKVLCQQLPKLYLPDDVDENIVRYLNLLMDKVPSCRPLPDTVSKNAFAKFQIAFTKKYEKQLEGLSAEEYLSHEQHQAETQFLNHIIPLEDHPVPPARRGRKRRSGSVTSSAAEDDASASKKNAPSRRGKAKRARLSTSDDSDSDNDSSDEEIEQGSPPASFRRSSTVPTRTMPRRQATRKPPVEVFTISSDSEEEEDTPRNIRPPPALDLKQERDNSEDEQASQMTVGYMQGDSDEEDEVSGLLADV
ncbi:nuclear condensing complex subunit [Lentinula aciculospora]|uniref:Nuclear condensing complex subunit n=1 Tax=Lentinula aciculospora TaxID=153920 RepID=A0A9W9A2V2_9AGAR|nr:nuclear condensing complex subunit [Lentinula aciculospora]